MAGKIMRIRNTFLWCVIVVSLLTIGSVSAQLPTKKIQNAQSTPTNEEWIKKVFVNLVWPLSEDNISIIKKQMDLSSDQITLITDLNKAYQAQQQYWKRLNADTSGNYRSDENTTREDEATAKKGYENCLKLAIQLRSSLGSEDKTFLSLLEEELFIRLSLESLTSKYPKASPDELVGHLMAKIKDHKNFFANKSPERTWWFKHKAIFFARTSLMHETIDSKKRKEVIESRNKAFKELMTH
jgi:hypothetical protein